MFEKFSSYQLRQMQKIKLANTVNENTEQILIDENEKASCINCSSTHLNQTTELYSNCAHHDSKSAEINSSIPVSAAELTDLGWDAFMYMELLAA